MTVKTIGPVNPESLGDQVLIQYGDDYFVVSSVHALFSGYETLVFPADAEGNITDWGDVAGGRGMSRAEAIANLAENGPRSWGDWDDDEDEEDD